MSILKYKYKAHKFINYAFYIVVFIFGFLLGFTTQKIDINKLISQVLMIDNVSAYTIYESDEFIIDEEYIYNAFTTSFENFNINTTNNIICNDQGHNYIKCFAFNSLFKESIEVVDPNTIIGQFKSTNGIDTGVYYYELTIYKDEIYKYYVEAIYENSSFPSGFVKNIFLFDNSKNWFTYTNFDTTAWGVSSNLNSKYNVLDFTGINLKFNENLFKDNPDFKEVCVDKGKKYSITTTNIDPITNSIFVSDFLWFPGKVTGAKYSEYDSLADDNILVFNDDVSTENYYFKDKEKIDSIFNDEIISNYFIHSGYTDKYSLYGYTAYKFIHSYYVDDDNNSQNVFTIFDFTDMNFSPFGSAGGSSGSFGDTPLTYCFYIKNEFNVTELQTNEWDDYVGIVPTPGGYLDVITSHNKNNSSNKVESFFSIINNLIAELKPTINFIKEHIEQLYLSMPLIVRNFILSFLVLIVIRILIGMVVK